MAKISKDQKECIARAATTKAFEKRELQWKKNDSKLAVECYNHVFPKKIRDSLAGVPDGWSIANPGYAVEEETTTIFHGSKSAKVTLTTQNGFSDLETTVNVVSGTTYVCTLRVYNPSGDNRVDVAFRIGQGTPNFIQRFATYSIADTWQQPTGLYTATTTGPITVEIRFTDSDNPDWNGFGITYIDYVEIVDQATLSKSEFEKLNFSMYPNPTSNGFVNITSITGDIASVAVFVNSAPLACACASVHLEFVICSAVTDDSLAINA